MQPPFPSPVPTWHNEIYPAIDPSKLGRTHDGKTIIITGAGSGIGRATAQAFASAGAKHIVLVGRTASTLQETKSSITGESTISVIAADVTDDAAVQKVADAVGTWDVLVLNAGYLPSPAPIAKADVGDYWKAYETNVKGAIVCSKVLFPSANTSGAAALAVVSGSLVMPVKMTVSMSAYQCSKFAMIKTMEYLAAENPNVFCASVHPGMVDTNIFRKSGATPDALPMDDVKLPAGFMVWCTLPEAHFLNGRFLWANWDVEELKAKAEEISAGDHLTANIVGWPFAP
ncbi:hypothetical protein BDV95DRAFT_575156 [Massariosphaeria phaeospora]|uniref:Uncharacterized protein n=1 Tax=Massariosphaeria phaeospora TaxID=100035 RepID=A0A7C8MCV5_9PLEO|nr:hypothetical protein BDV95DRAFT_575156 [Massariosphaeria phaeospora]